MIRIVDNGKTFPDTWIERKCGYKSGFFNNFAFSWLREKRLMTFERQKGLPLSFCFVGEIILPEFFFIGIDNRCASIEVYLFANCQGKRLWFWWNRKYVLIEKIVKQDEFYNFQLYFLFACAFLKVATVQISRFRC